MTTHELSSARSTVSPIFRVASGALLAGGAYFGTQAAVNIFQYHSNIQEASAHNDQAAEQFSSRIVDGLNGPIILSEANDQQANAHHAQAQESLDASSANLEAFKQDGIALGAIAAGFVVVRAASRRAEG